MTDPVSDLARRTLRDAGHPPLAVLGAGMEGVVVEVGGGRVAKIWRHASPAAARRLQAFYDALRDATPDIVAPRIHAVLDAGGCAITVEERLGGRPLRSTMGDDRYVVDDEHVAVIGTVLGALAAVPANPALGLLPMLPGEPPAPVDASFAASLAALVERRAHRFRGPLAAAVDSLDAVVSATVRSLHAVQAPAGLIHGDLIPANILVGAAGPPAVLDFGFLTAVGDPCFDAAVTASVYDMYGPRHRDNERVLDDAFVGRFGYRRQRLGVYRAAYALTTSNCYSASGSDGHFAWCAAMLARPDVRAAIGL